MDEMTNFSLIDLVDANDTDLVKKLLQDKNDYDQHDLDNSLCYAVINQNLDIIKLLVTHGANIHVSDELALRRASSNGHLDVVKLLVSQGADIHASDELGLRLASEYGHLDVVKYLVSKGANIHAIDDFALRLASHYGHLDVVSYLQGQMLKEKLLAVESL